MYILNRVSIFVSFPYCSSCQQKLLLEAKRKLGEILSAFEFLDSEAVDLVMLLCYCILLWILQLVNIFKWKADCLK